MARRALIALVGRPNVGKSALFNAIIGRRVAIVDEEEGVTRDRLYASTEQFGRHFDVIDTGGISAKGSGIFSDDVTRQAHIAIEEADSIIQVVDATVGISPLDLEVAKILRRTKKPVCLAVNKVDNEQRNDLIDTFATLGIPTMIPVSALHRNNIAELIDAAITPLNSADFSDEPANTPPKVAIIGRPNVGKSLFVNTLLGEARCIVSPIAGTTRDSVDTEVTIDEHPYILIDTAGIRRKHKERDVIEKFASLRTARALERADVSILLLDCLQGLTTEDKKIISDIEEAGKGCVLALNKWDLVKGFRMEHALQGFDEENIFVKHCPKICISALTGRNVDKVFSHVNEVLESSNRRITTHQLNKAVMAWLQQYHPPVIGGKRLRIYYLSQVGINPPRFILFVNSPKLLDESYKRYLINQLRKTFNFSGIPLVFHVRGKEERSAVERITAQKQKNKDRDFAHIEKALDRDEDEDLDDFEGEE